MRKLINTVHGMDEYLLDLEGKFRIIYTTDPVEKWS